MLIGVPSEIKEQEFRVGLTPASVQKLTYHGHNVLVQDQAGYGAGFGNKDYESAGAKIIDKAEDKKMITLENLDKPSSINELLKTNMISHEEKNSKDERDKRTIVVKNIIKFNDLLFIKAPIIKNIIELKARVISGIRLTKSCIEIPILNC